MSILQESNHYIGSGRFKGLNATILKLVAILCMLMDHAAASIVKHLILPSLTYEPSMLIMWQEAYRWMRAIGRCAFPIFCFFLVEGFFKTKNRKKYFLRLLIFAFISEIPFDLGLYGKLLYFGHQNVFFTLAIGLFALCIIDKYESYVIKLAISALAVLFAYLIRTDYDALGIMLIIFFYFFCSIRFSKEVIGGVFIFSELSNTKAIAAIAIYAIPLYFYNGKRGRGLKYFFYVFYPLHLVVLGIVLMLMKQ